MSARKIATDLKKIQLKFNYKTDDYAVFSDVSELDYIKGVHPEHIYKMPLREYKKRGEPKEIPYNFRVDD